MVEGSWPRQYLSRKIEQREESGDAKADEYEDGQEREEATNCSGLGNQVIVGPCQGRSGLHVEPPQQDVN
ncbi:hypothetical protein N658DRAFT_500279 [Parathielavia hyrcaniae]|uniref:Uncharacterized protein n=1 Tax=Parathielavia hyrcaniae TaxID=113614 RepID=A0AAN6SYE0_9PEZI|nr:hypothetical protein N658DRAFT_500279 [Parathielavia hyrcaniae]